MRALKYGVKAVRRTHKKPSVDPHDMETASSSQSCLIQKVILLPGGTQNAFNDRQKTHDRRPKPCRLLLPHDPKGTPASSVRDSGCLAHPALCPAVLGFPRSQKIAVIGSKLCRQDMTSSGIIAAQHKTYSFNTMLKPPVVL